jgi:hypothetical protein
MLALIAEGVDLLFAPNSDITMEERALHLSTGAMHYIQGTELRSILANAPGNRTLPGFCFLHREREIVLIVISFANKEGIAFPSRRRRGRRNC